MPAATDRIAHALGIATAIVLTSCSPTPSGPDVSRAKTIETTKRHNILFIALEDWNATTMGYAGHPLVQTPRIDSLAASATVFSRAYCQAPVCNPSKASFLTGRYPWHTRVVANPDRMEDRLPNDIPTLPLWLREARPGATLANVGKLFFSTSFAPRSMAAFHRLEECDLPTGYTGVHRGFELPEGSRPERVPGFRFTPDPELDAELTRRFEERKRLDELTPKDAPNRWEIVDKHFQNLHAELAGDSGRHEEHEEDGRVARAAAQVIGELAEARQSATGDQGEPFLLTVTFAKPHTPFLCPKEYVDLYPAETMPLPVAPPSDDVGIPDVALRFGNNWDIFNQLEPTPDRQRQALAAYLACCSFIDAQVGIVLDALDEAGITDETIVILVADHGTHLGEHGLWGKLTLFEQSLRVPLIIRVPGTNGVGRTIDHDNVELVDLIPTIAELWGLEAPAKMDGQSLVPALIDPGMPENSNVRPAVSICDFGWGRGISARVGDVRTTEWRWGEDGERTLEVYDLKADPLQQNNLPGEPSEVISGIWQDLDSIQ